MIRCDACIFKEYGTSDYPCSECDATNNMFKPKAITNADKIRAMNDEELADWVYTHDCITVKNGRLNKEQLIKWFQSEAE